MPHLLVEAGNTALKAAWAEGTTLGKTFRYQGERMMDYLLSLLDKERPEVLTVASAFGISAGEEALLRARCGELLILDGAHTELLSSRNYPEYLSYDRAAGLVAAGFLFKDKPVTVFDFGTTLTVDFLSREGAYLGGNVSLGCRTRFKALNRYSRALPLVNVQEETPVLGDSATTSMTAGVVSGILFEIEGYIGLKPENIIVFTGGDAIYFAKRMKNSIFVVCNLVLMGLALMADEYVKNL